MSGSFTMFVIYYRRCEMRNVIIIGFIFLLSAPAWAERILLIGDPQYGWFGMRECKEERKNFQKIIDIANEEKFYTLIILGDLADSYPKTSWKRARQVDLFLNSIAKIKSARVIFVAGNHDLGEEMTPETMRKFEKDFGAPTWFVFNLGGYKFLVINTTLFRNRERLPRLYDEQMKFIERNRDAKFILGHHPPFQKKAPQSKGYYNWPPKVWRAIAPLFPPDTYFFSGHTHRPFQRIIYDFHIINPGTCCAPWRNGFTSYGVLEINNGQIKYQKYILR